jgi:mono/diheme cytochrome c family protein
MRNGAPTSILSILVFLLCAIPLLLDSLTAESRGTSALASPSSSTGTPRIPAEAHHRKNPVPDVPGAVRAGGDLFATQCAMCHAANGDGRGDLAVSLKVKVPDLRAPALQKNRTDGDLFYIISTGHADMPPEKRLSEKNRWEIVRFIRSLGKKAEKPKS